MQRVSHTTSIRVNAPPEEALPLFTAKGEELWVAGWKPKYIYPESGETEVGLIWTTAINDTTRAIWVTVEYDSEKGTASYVKWTPDKHVTRIDVRCDPAEHDKTIATVTYTLTALGEAGYSDIEALTEDHYEARIASWERAINHYLEFDELLMHE